MKANTKQRHLKVNKNKMIWENQIWKPVYSISNNLQLGRCETGNWFWNEWWWFSTKCNHIKDI